MIDGKMLLIDSLMDRLNSFQDSKQVAEFLESEHARGYKGDSDTCVITSWLEDKTGLDVATDDEVRFYTPYGVSDLEHFKTAQISDAVADFINDFDNGAFPQLEWGDVED